MSRKWGESFTYWILKTKQNQTKQNQPGFHSYINHEQDAWAIHLHSFLLEIQRLICWHLKETPITLHMTFISSTRFASTLFLCHRHDTVSSSLPCLQNAKTIQVFLAFHEHKAYAVLGQHRPRATTTYNLSAPSELLSAPAAVFLVPHATPTAP